MAMHIIIEKKHAIVFALCTIFILSIALVTAFGTNNPAVFGHSDREIIVTNYSIQSNSIGAAEINSTSLASECSSITGSSALCDGGDGIGISSCTFYDNTCGSTTTCTASCGGGRITGGGCNCNGVAMTGHTLSGGAGGFSGSVTCTCLSSTTVNARAECCD